MKTVVCYSCALFNEGLVNGKPVITGILPVERAIEPFDLAADKSQSLKVQISFQNA